MMNETAMYVLTSPMQPFSELAQEVEFPARELGPVLTVEYVSSALHIAHRVSVRVGTSQQVLQSHGYHLIPARCLQ